MTRDAGNKIIDLGEGKKIVDLDRGNLYLGEGRGEVFLKPDELKWLYYNYGFKSRPLFKPRYGEKKFNQNGIGELRYDNGKLYLIDASGNSYDITKESKDTGFNFYRFIADLGLERTGLGGGEFNGEFHFEDGKRPKKKSVLNKIGTLAVTGLIGAGIFYMGFAENCGHQSKIKYEDVCTDMKKINSTLHEKGFSYRFDNITDNVNLHEIVPYNFKITGQGSFGIDIAIDDNKIPENIKTFKALVELGFILKNNKEIAPQMNCYKFLVGEKENYPVEITIPMTDHPNDIIPPSELVKSKSGDCEDYSLLYASYFNAKHIPAFIVIDNGHAVAAVGDIPSDSDELKEYIKENRTFIVGSSEYLNKYKSFNFSITVKPSCTRDILNNLKIKYSSADIRTIISKDNIWTKEGPLYFNLSEFGYFDKEYAKSAADNLNMNISKDEIDKMANEYCEFYGTLVKIAIEAQRGNSEKFYQKIKNVLNDPYEEKAVEDFFNKTFY